jgi:hypothetical protein
MEAAISAFISHPNVVQAYTYLLQPEGGSGGRRQRGEAAAAAEAAAPTARGNASSTPQRFLLNIDLQTLELRPIW